jgi:hypothetical protein
MLENIQKKLSDTATIMLEDAGIFREYTDGDLFDAALVFSTVLFSHTFKAHKDFISKEQMEMLAHEAGESIRQTILVFTKKDMHEVAKNLIDKK